MLSLKELHSLNTKANLVAKTEIHKRLIISSTSPLVIGRARRVLQFRSFYFDYMYVHRASHG